MLHLVASVSATAAAAAATAAGPRACSNLWPNDNFWPCRRIVRELQLSGEAAVAITRPGSSTSSGCGSAAARCCVRTILCGAW